MNAQKLLRLFLFCIVMYLSLPCKAQLNYAGKNFFITCGGSVGVPYSSTFDVMLSSKHQASVQFAYLMPMGGMPPSSYTLTPGTVTRVNFSSYQMWPLSNLYFDQVMNQSLHITSDSDIIVQIVDRDGAADDGTSVLPTDQQKKARTYMLLTLGDRLSNSSTLSFSIVATCDSTVLEIIPKTATTTHPANVSFHITLNKGQTYQLSTPGTGLQPLNTNRDLSGSIINVLHSKADVPINIFCHTAPIYCVPHDYVTYPTGCCADRLLEQVLPVEWMDTLIPFIPIYHHQKSRVKILSAYPNNPVYFDGTYIATLNTGELIDTTVDRAVMIRAAQPIAVAKFMLSDSFTPDLSDDGDPDMFWGISPSQGIRESYFRLFGPLANSPAGGNVDRVAVSIVAPDSLVNQILLDGNNVSGYFNPFPSAPGWQYAHVPLDSQDVTTNHHIWSPVKIVAYFQRMYTQGGYSFNLSDVNVDSIAAFSSQVAMYDTLEKCKGAAATLTPGPDHSPPYEWSTGATSSSITVTDTGTYWVRDVIHYSCYSVPAITYFEVKDTQAQVITDVITDTIIKCKNQMVTLNASAALSYEWFNGDGASQVQVADTGLFFVNEIFYEDPCIRQQKVHRFYVRDFHIDFSLGVDTVACDGDEVYLIMPFAGTVWSTGDTGKITVVTAPGEYSAHYMDSCGTLHEDTIVVYFQFCPERFCNISFPSAFSPNNDGRNDVFRPLTYGLFTGYSLSVYDRWGKLVFQSYKIEDGWNGLVNGTPGELGTYMFLCQVTCPAKGTQLIKGDITLVR